MKRRLLAVLLFCCCGHVLLLAQTSDWRTYLEQLAEDEIDETTLENMYEELLSLESNPLNLNTVTRDQLERFPLLSPEDAAKISDFLQKNRPVYSVYELRNVPRLDYSIIERIISFFYAGESEKPKAPGLKEILEKGRNDLQFRFDKTLTKRAGYGEFTDSVLSKYPNRKYRGEDFYTSLRYAFAYRDKIQFGLTAEKDAGEAFFRKNYAKGYDHYGFHFILRDAGKLKTLAVGDYRLSFGQGLILNNDFLSPKSWGTENVIRRTQAPKRHFSTAENGFFRGASGVVSLNDFALTLFYSNRNVDANLSDKGEITSFKTDGYHRTPLEMEKKHNTREQVTGANVNYRKNRLQIGVSGVYYGYNRTYSPTLHNYNRYWLRDSANANASVDYSYRFSKLIVAGETAVAKNGAVATLNALHYAPSQSLSFSALYRNYPISYNALYAKAFSEGSDAQNENGFYLGSNFRPFRKVAVTTYIDWVRFPWLKYGIDTPSQAIDYYLLTSYAFSSSSSLEARYKFKRKEKNTAYPDEKSSSVLPYDTHKMRLRYSIALASGWSFRSSADATFYKEKHFPKEWGYMLSQNVSYRGDKKWNGDFFAGYFNADSYDVRLYSYERNLLNTFYMPSFYGEGIRLALSAKWQISPALSFAVKGGYTRYFNRESIGSGTELIDGNSRMDVYSYLRWRF
ncbi:MAG: helix-hairpin-helix domain-containing protein [Dysgonamonadaceae bacterium]|jgi:hypothetical protein|nr:helix-hairpin-helix domain-containing protein [Dysgonamonadaceae bacterium]